MAEDDQKDAIFETYQPPSMVVAHVYRHPQGSTITVYADGSLDARNARGKRKKTSATAEKLASGHGLWVEVTRPE